MTEHVARTLQDAEHIADTLKALAHPIRLRIIGILCEGDQNVNALAERLSVKQAIVSQQLRILRMRNIVDVARRNGFAYYRLAEPRLRELIRCMSNCGTSTADRGDARTRNCPAATTHLEEERQ